MALLMMTVDCLDQRRVGNRGYVCFASLLLTMIMSFSVSNMIYIDKHLSRYSNHVTRRIEGTIMRAHEIEPSGASGSQSFHFMKLWYSRYVRSSILLPSRSNVCRQGGKVAGWRGPLNQEYGSPALAVLQSPYPTLPQSSPWSRGLSPLSWPCALAPSKRNNGSSFNTAGLL